MDVESGQPESADAMSPEDAPVAGSGTVGDRTVDDGSAGDSSAGDGTASNGAAPRDAGDAAKDDTAAHDSASGDNADSNGSGEAGADENSADDGGSGKDDGAQASAAPVRKRPFWRELFIIVLAALVLTVVIKVFLFQVFSIPSASMENTLQPGDRILVNRLVYHLRGIDRGDIVVFSGDGSWGPPPPPLPSNPVERTWEDFTNLIGLSAPGTDYVKRVIGLPGDHVKCCDAEGRVTVNGVALNESSYLYPGDQPNSDGTPYSIVVPPGRLFVLGDHRSDSCDSRCHMGTGDYGTIPVNEVVGRAFVIIWPPSRIGDLPIPNTFKQAALNASAAAVNYGPAVTGGSAAAAVLVWRRRRSRRRSG
jgi:signal peptidase I